MYATKIYYYSQRQEVVMVDGNSSRSYVKVYSKELSVVKGVDNQLQFQFLNQDQKPVNLTDKTVTARIISADGKTILLQKTLDEIYIITGLMKLELTSAELDSIDNQKAYYSLSISNSTNEYPAFVDAQGHSRGILNIMNGVMSDFVPSAHVIIPTHTPVMPGIPQTYSSSVIPTLNRSVSSIQAIFEMFTGTFQLVGSVTSDFSLSYDISPPETLIGYTGSIGRTINGYHPYIKLVFVNQDVTGDVISILYR